MQAFLPMKPEIPSGKMIRTRLCGFFGGVFKVPDPQIEIQAFAAEGIHLASLIVDDLLDGHETRRGKPSVAALLGGKKGVNLAFLLISGLLKDSQTLSFLERRIIDRTLRHMALGELGLKDYQKTCDLKTASLFCLTGLLPAFHAGADTVKIRQVFKFLKTAGRIYQYQDDLADGDAPVSREWIENLLSKEKIQIQNNFEGLGFLSAAQKDWLFNAISRWF